MVRLQRIHGTLRVSAVVAVDTVFTIEHVIGVTNILALGDAIARGTLALDSEEIAMDRSLFEVRAEHALVLLHNLPSGGIERLEFASVFRVGQLLVLEAVLPVAEIPAPEAIAARLTVEAKSAIGAVLTFMKVCTGNTLLAVHTFGAELAVLCSETVGTVFAMDAEIRDIEAILVISRIDAHVTILVVGRVMRKCGILTPHVHDAWTRRHAAQLGELLEERPAEIERATRRELIPLVRPPDGLVVDRARLVLRVNGNHFLSRQVASAMVELPLVAIHQSTLLATIRTQCRRRKQKFLTSECRRKLLQESKIASSDLKWLSAP